MLHVVIANIIQNSIKSCNLKIKPVHSTKYILSSPLFFNILVFIFYVNYTKHIQPYNDINQDLVTKYQYEKVPLQ